MLLGSWVIFYSLSHSSACHCVQSRMPLKHRGIYNIQAPDIHKGGEQPLHPKPSTQVIMNGSHFMFRERPA